MARIRKWLLRVAAALVLTVLALGIGLVVFTRTARFHELLRAEIVALADASIRGSVSVGGIEGSIWDTLRLHDVVVRDDEGRVARVDRIEASASLWPLLHGGGPVVGVAIFSPHLRLVQGDDGRWNAEKAFASPQTADAQDGGASEWLRLSIDPLQIRSGEVRILQPHGRVRIRHLSADAAAEITPQGLAAEVESLHAKLLAYGSPPAELSGSLAYESASQRLDVDGVALRTLRSSLRLDGRLEQDGRIEARAEVRLSPLDLRAFVGASPLAVPVSGALEASGTLADLHARARLEAAGGEVDADLTADLTGDEPRYRVEANASEIRLGELLEGDQVAGRLRAHATAHGHGTAPAGIAVQATVEVAALVLGDRSAGDLSLVASLEQRRLTVDAETRGGLARIDLASTVELADPLRYRATATIEKLDPAVFAGGESPPHGELDLRLALDGSGTSLETARAEATVELEKSNVGDVRIDRGLLQASLADRRVRIGARLVANDALLAASGDLGTARDASGRVSYSLKVPNLRPWLALAEQAGGGSLDLEGSAEGSLQSLALDARLEGSELETAGVAVEGATAVVDLSGLDLAAGKTPAPRGSIDVSLRNVTGEVSFARVDAGIELHGREPANVSVTTRDEAGWMQRATAEVDYAGSERRVHLTEIALETPAGPWRLAALATVTQRGDSIAVDDLVLRNAGQSIEVRGRLAPSLDVSAHARGVDLASLNAFQNRDLGDFAGRLEADLKLTGTTARPVATGELHLAGGAVRAKPLGVAIHDVTVDVAAQEGELRVETFTAQAGEGSIAASGSLGLVGYVPRELAVNVRIDNWPAIDTRRYRATIGGNIVLGGSLAAPQVRGAIDVLHASLHPDLAILSEQRIEGDPTIVVVGRKEAQPEKPTADEDGAAGETETPAMYDAMTIDLTVRIPRDAWIRHPDGSVEIQGEVHVQKTPGAPLQLVGKVETVRGWLAFRGRRFSLQSGEIRFTGGEPIDPALLVVAEHRFPEYDVEIVIGGTASKPTLTLRSDPALPQADVLALILFGKPVGQLGEGEQESLGRQAATIAGNYAVGELAQSVTNALGLEDLGIDIRQVDVEGGTVGFGKYLTDKTYVAIDQSVTGGTKVTIEYEIYPRVKVQTSTTSEGESEAGIFWKKRY